MRRYKLLLQRLSVKGTERDITQEAMAGKPRASPGAPSDLGRDAFRLPAALPVFSPPTPPGGAAGNILKGFHSLTEGEERNAAA